MNRKIVEGLGEWGAGFVLAGPVADILTHIGQNDLSFAAKTGGVALGITGVIRAGNELLAMQQTSAPKDIEA
jgi:hypothetical protein